MRVNVNIKTLSSRKPGVTPVPFELETAPQTVGELITETVKACVRDYNARVRRGENAQPVPLTRAQITDMASLGRVAFGINYGGKEQDEDKAVANALQSFEDGLFALFIGDTKAESPDEVITLNEGDTLTFVRLTMLSGRMW